MREGVAQLISKSAGIKALLCITSAFSFISCTKSADLSGLVGSTAPLSVIESGGSSSSTLASDMLISGSVALGFVGTCYGPFTVTTVNNQNTTTAVAIDESVNLTLNGAGTFYSDSSCLSSTNSLSILTGSSSATFYYIGNTVSFQTFYATATGLGNATYPFNVKAGSPSAIVITGSGSVAASSCSSAITATLKDVGNNTAQAASPLTLTLSGQANGAYYSDAACSSSVITTATIATNASSSTFYFKDNTAQSLNVTVASGGLTSGTLPVTVSAASSPTRLSISSSASVTYAGTCYGPITITTTDNSGIAIASSSSTAVTVTNSGSGAFYSNSACTTALVSNTATIAANASSVGVYFESPVAETQTFFAAAAGFTGTSSSFTVLANAPSVIQLSGPSVVSGGICSTAITATLKDSSGNNAKTSGGSTLTLSGASLGAFYTDSGCSSSTTSISVSSNQSTAVFYFKDSTGESPTLTAASGGLTSGTLAITVSAPSTPTKLLFTSATSYTSAGTCYGPITVKTTDANNASVAVSSSTVVALNGAGSGAYYTTNTCGTTTTSVTIAANSSQTTFYYKNNSVENELFVGTNGSLATATLPFTVQAGIPAKFTITGASTIASGQCSAAYTLYLRDTLNNLVASTGTTTATLSGAGSGAYYSDSGCATPITSLNIADSTSSYVFYIKDATAEALTLSATNASLTTGTSAVTVQAGTATKLTLTVPSSALTGVCSGAFTITSKDASNNTANVTGGAAVVQLTGAGNGTFYSDSGCTGSVTNVSIGSNTSSQVFYFKDSTAETLTFTATSTNQSAGVSSYTVISNVLNKLVLSGATSASNEVCSAQMTVTSTDQYGNPQSVGGSSFPVGLSTSGSGTFYSDACITPVTSIPIAANGHSVNFYYKGTAVGSVTLTASGTGVGNGTESFNVIASTPTKLVITGSTTPVTNSCGAYTVQVQDTNSYNTVVAANTTVTFSNSGYGVFYSDVACTLPITTASISSGGGNVVIYFQDQIGESPVLTAAASGLTSGTLTLTEAQVGMTAQGILAGTIQGYGYNEGIQGASRFNTPQTVYANGSTLYIMDSGNGLIRSMNLTGGANYQTGYLTGVPGVNSTSDLNGNSSTGGSYVLNATYDGGKPVLLGGNLYWSGYDEIRALNLSSGVSSTIAGVYSSAGTTNGQGAAARFSYPHDIVTDGTNLFVADYSNYCIREISSTYAVTTLAGICGSTGNVDGALGTAKFAGPTGLVIDPTNTYLYVTDYTNNSIRQVTIATGAVVTIAGSTSATSGFRDGTGAGTATTNPQFHSPISIDINPAGTNLYVADYGNNAVRSIAISGGGTVFTVSTIAGGATGFLDSTAEGGQFNNITGLSYSGGNLFIADNSNNAIRMLNLTTYAVTTVGGMSPTYFPNAGGTVTNSDGIGVLARYYYPNHMVQVGNMLYMTESYSTVRSINLLTHQSTTIAGVFNTAGTSNGNGSAARFGASLYGITSDGTNLYISDTGNSCIRQMVISTGVVSTLAGICGTSGYVDGALGTAKFSSPNAITIDTTHTNLFVADTSNNVIRQVVISSGLTSTLAGNTAGTAGLRDGTGAGTTGSYPEFSGPKGIVYVSGTLYVADASNYAVRSVVVSSGLVTTITGGTSGYANGAGTSSRFGSVNDVCSDGTNLYIVEAQGRIRKMVISSGMVSTFIGQAPPFNSLPTNNPNGDTTDGTLTLAANTLLSCFASSTGLFYTNGNATTYGGQGIRWVR